MIDSSFNTMIELNKKNQNQAKDYHGMKGYTIEVQNHHKTDFLLQND